jgi:hypothetical protein
MEILPANRRKTEAPPPAIETRRCDGCDADFRPARPWSRFCCPACRAYRSRPCSRPGPRSSGEGPPLNGDGPRQSCLASPTRLRIDFQVGERPTAIPDGILRVDPVRALNWPMVTPTPAPDRRLPIARCRAWARARLPFDRRENRRARASTRHDRLARRASVCLGFWPYFVTRPRIGIEPFSRRGRCEKPQKHAIQATWRSRSASNPVHAKPTRSRALSRRPARLVGGKLRLSALP